VAEAKEGGASLGAFLPTKPPSPEGDGVEIVGAFHAEGGDVPCTVRWTPTKEGLLAEITCEGAGRVGLATDLVAAHLNGVVNALGDFTPQTIPTSTGPALSRVSKTLAGDPMVQPGRLATLVSFIPAEGRPEGTLQVVQAPDSDLVRLVHWVDGTTAKIEVVTDFSLQQGQAKSRLADAKAQAASRPAVAIRLLRGVAQEYPFDKAVAQEAIRVADELEKDSLRQIDEFATALDRYRIYRSQEALGQVEEKYSRKLASQFLTAGTAANEMGPLETRVDELVRAATDARRDHDRANALPELLRLEKVVSLLASSTGGTEGGPARDYKLVAAVYADAILDRFKAWEGEDSDLGRRIQAIRKLAEELKDPKESPGVADALPPAPGAKPAPPAPPPDGDGGEEKPN
jgi:hypothetical protein